MWRRDGLKLRQCQNWFAKFYYCHVKSFLELFFFFFQSKEIRALKLTERWQKGNRAKWSSFYFSRNKFCLSFAHTRMKTQLLFDQPDKLPWISYLILYYVQDHTHTCTQRFASVKKSCEKKTDSVLLLFSASEILSQPL